MKLENNPTFTRPGVALLIAGVAALVLRPLIDGVPGIGGLLAWVFLLSGLFFVVGGAFLLVKRSGS